MKSRYRAPNPALRRRVLAALLYLVILALVFALWPAYRAGAVATPTLTLLPDHGPCATRPFARGAGFPAGAKVALFSARGGKPADGRGHQISEALAGADGGFAVTLPTVGAGCDDRDGRTPAGTRYTITAAVAGGDDPSARAVFTIAAALEPALRIEPERGRCDGEYTVRGYGFAPLERQTLYVRVGSRPPSAPLDAFEMVADSFGNLAVALPPGLLSCLPTTGPDGAERHELFVPADARPGGFERALTATVTTTPSPGACFPETGFCVAGRFYQHWRATGGLAINGYPLSGVSTERLEDGQQYAVQYFERVRLEAHPEAGPPYDVQLGQFGRRIRPADPPAPRLAGATYYDQTGHNLGGRFRAYWEARGGLDQFGLPISEEFEERLEDGTVYRVQYFERARFEHHPEHAPPHDILLGQFGRRILATVPGR